MSNITQDPTTGGGGPHASTHASGGTDPVTPASIGAAAAAHTHTPAQVGLSNVTNDAQVKRSEIGTGLGVAPLDANLKVPAAHLPPANGAIPAALLDFKGDLVVASAADTAARLGVGADGQVLTADAATALGVRWGAPGADATKIRGVPVSTTAPASGQILKYNGTEYAPAADNAGSSGGSAPGFTSPATAADGTTDDRAAIQGALDTGANVWLKAGVHAISAPLVMKTAGQILRGAGRGATTLKALNFSGPMILVGTRGTDSLVTRGKLVPSLVTGAGNAFKYFDRQVAANQFPHLLYEDFWMLRWSRGSRIDGLTGFCLRGFYQQTAATNYEGYIAGSVGRLVKEAGTQTAAALISQNPDGLMRCRMRLEPQAGGTHVVVDSGGIAGTAPATGTTREYALTFDGTTVRFFIGGTLVYSNAPAGGPFKIVQHPYENVTLGHSYQGIRNAVEYTPAPGIADSWEIRSAATYTAAYTPGTAKFVSDANTLILMNGELPADTELAKWCVIARGNGQGGATQYIPWGPHNTPGANIQTPNISDLSIDGQATGSGIYVAGAHGMRMDNLGLVACWLGVFYDRNSYFMRTRNVDVLYGVSGENGWVGLIAGWGGVSDHEQWEINGYTIGGEIGSNEASVNFRRSWVHGGNIFLPFLVHGALNDDFTKLDFSGTYCTDEGTNTTDRWKPIAGLVLDRATFFTAKHFSVDFGYAATAGKPCVIISGGTARFEDSRFKTNGTPPAIFSHTDPIGGGALRALNASPADKPILLDRAVRTNTAIPWDPDPATNIRFVAQTTVEP